MLLARKEPGTRRKHKLVAYSLPFVAALFGGIALAAACGPSQQSIYEGTVRFEHCYRLDLDLEIAPGHRQACWRHWLGAYTYGQPRDRIEYARRRLRAFALGDMSRPALNLETEQRPEARQFYLVVPSPTSVYAPPPPIATRWSAESKAPPADAGSDADADAEVSEAPADSCARDCRTSFSTCQSDCDADAAPTGKCKRCDPDYKLCMRRCFQ